MKKHLHVFLTLALLFGTATMALPQGNDQGHAVSNAVKYRNNGVQPATGRSGSASLEVRALMANDGSTQLEATTGSLEAGTKPGNIEKTQVKILIGDTPAKNYNNLSGGGYWSVTYSGLSRGDQVQVQANVSGIDGRRTDVVTATARASLRPDLAVGAVTGPAEAAPHMPVSFTALVSELHGDVGARATCVLAIDGAAVDQAHGIWVDAGGNVSCLFTHVFASPGTYAVSVAATDVNPGDWDTANNSAATSITITEPGSPIQNGHMQAGQVNRTIHWEGENHGGSYPYDYRQDSIENYSFASIYGWERGFEAGGMQRVDATLFANGAVVHTASLTPTWTWEYDDGNRYHYCAQYYSVSWDGSRYISSGDYASGCSFGYRSDPGSQSAHYVYQRISGDVTYYGHQFYCDAWGCNTYDWNSGTTYGSGADLGWTGGSVIRLTMDFVDRAGVSHTADHSVTLQDYSSAVNYSYGACYEDWYRGGTSCWRETSSGTYALGDSYWP